MNLFRSEEHARSWEGFDDSMVTALMPISAWAEMFSNPFFRERGRPDYVSWLRSPAGSAAFSELRQRLPRPASS
jgi:hypothetical protein